MRDAIAAGLFGPPVDNPLSPIASNDDRMGTAAFADGLVWGSLTTALTFSKNGPAHAGAAWFAVRPSVQEGSLRASIVNQGYVSVKDEDVIFPGIAINAQGKGALAFTLTGKNRHPSAAYVRIDRGGTSAVHLAAAGVGPQDGFSGYRFATTDPAPRPRWGDYTGTAVDETGKIWFEAEYIAQTCTFEAFLGDTTCGGTRTTLANWATFIGRVTP